MSIKYEGKLTGHIGRIVFGWAWYPLEPLRTVYVEILLDGITVACVSAQLYDTKLKKQFKGTGYYAFSYMLPEHALKNIDIIQAKFANQNQYLDGKILILKDKESQKQALPLDVQLQHDGGLTLKGWVKDPFKASKRFTIECFYKGEVIESIETGIMKGEEGTFKIQLPQFLADGLTHEVDVKIDHEIHLPGSPLNVWLPPQGVMGLLDLLYQAGSNKANETLKNSYNLLYHLWENYEKRFLKSLKFSDYEPWSQRYDDTSKMDDALLATFVLVVVTRSEINMTRTLKSLLQQTHTNWLVWVDGEIPTEFQNNPKIKVRPEEYTIEGVFNGSKDLLTFIEAGDCLSTNALQQVVAIFASSKKIGIVYSDCDQEDENGKKISPWFKPAWDPDLFLSLNYIDELCVIKAENIKQIPKNLKQLPWLAVEVCLVDNQDIVHCPHVLYHCRFQSEPSNEIALQHLQWCENYLKNQEPDAQVIANPNAPFLRKISRITPKQQPLISLIIPTKDQAKLLQTCVESIEKKSSYRNYEIIIVDNQTTDADALALLTCFKARGHTVLKYDKAFNYSAINNFAVEHAKGDIIGLINNDIEIMTPDWLEEMLTLLLRPNIGAVGAKLLWPNDMVQHGGVLLGVNNLAGHIGNENMKNHLGYHGLLQVTRRVGAVTAACLLTRKRDYINLGGLDELHFPVAFNDVDYCLKLAKYNLACVWTPFARMIHAESVSRGKDDTPEKTARAQMEMNYLREQWMEALMHDRYYHPSLSLSSLDAPFSALALPPRDRTPRW
ncbi:MAG: glycosyltransferase [Methylococcales bacterium]|nr:glycosyltransferase [Methylococcales bacterium]